MKRVVVVGTGTGVGKTAVSAALLTGLVAAGRSALGLKPIESGVSPDRPGDSDAAQLGNAAGHPPWSLVALREALSPHLAAEREGRTINVRDVVAWVHAREQGAAPGTWTIVETAGGLCSPLSLIASNLDLVTRLGTSEIALVSPNRLGVLHDVMACVSLLQHSGLAPALIVLTDALGRDASSSTNARELTRLSQRPAREYSPGIAARDVAAWFAA